MTRDEVIARLAVLENRVESLEAQLVDQDPGLRPIIAAQLAAVRAEIAILHRAVYG